MSDKQPRAATFHTLRASLLGLMMTGLAACGGDPLVRSDGGSVTRPDGTTSSASSPASSSSAASESSAAPVSSSSAASSASSAPDSEKPEDLPLVVRGEHFDRYHDTTPEQLGDCDRDTPVDLGLSEDGESCDVGWTEAGEWLEYDVNLSTAGTYSFALSVGSGLSGREIAVLVNGTAVGTLDVPNIGWSSFEEIVLPEVAFNDGLNTVRVEFVTGGTNFSYFRIGDASDELPEQPEGVVVAIRSGGSSYTSGDGIIYIPDAPFASAGQRSTTRESISGTDDERLYRTERWGNFRYELPIENGVYDVTLKMVEMYWNAVGERVFNIYIEEQPIVTDLDIYYMVGNHTAFDLTAGNVEVADGSLTIDFEASVDNATISAILVERVGSGEESSSSSASSEASSSSVAEVSSSSEASSSSVAEVSSSSEASSSSVAEVSSSSEASSSSVAEVSSSSEASSSSVAEVSSSSEASSSSVAEVSSSSEASSSSVAEVSSSSEASSSSVAESSASSSSSSSSAPADSDGDGVTDDIDQCPNTPAGEPVNEVGCALSQLDSDNDGVTDDIDQCPNTPAGEPVNEVGCALSQLDSDNDGVTDDIDQCPNTPAGEPVNEVGCALSQLDSDNDGVTDDLDQCPNTPAGEPVNEVGCALSQLDSDNDGVTDDLDQCPNTPEGEPVNEVGCALSQLDSDNDGVTDDIDQCPNTPEGESVNDVGCSTSQLDGDPVEGASIWTTNCAGCHGNFANDPDAPSRAIDPNNLTNAGAQAGLATFIESEMQFFGACTGQCAADVAEYFLTLEEAPEPEPEPLGDAANGAELYGDNCAGCHGGQGQGMGSFPSVQGATADDLRAIIGAGGTMTALFGSLPDSEIEDLGAFMSGL